MQWCTENGKAIVSIAESFDLTTPAGRMVAQIMVVFAEFERERIGERAAESAAKLAKVGRWRGGKVPFGYQRAGVKGAYTLAQDPATAPILAKMAAMAISGQSNGKIAAWLNSQGVASPKGGYAWNSEIVRVMLRNPTAAGRMILNGKTVRNDDGDIVMATDNPVIDGPTWDLLQSALGSRSQVHAERKGGHQLLRVLYCKACSPETGTHTHKEGERCTAQRCMRPMYGAIGQGRGKRDVYRCLNCGLSIPMATAEATITKLVLKYIGGRYIPRKVVTAAVDHTTELRDVERSIADIESMVESGEMPARSAARMLTSLEARQERLAAMPQIPEQVAYVLTDVTVAQKWEQMTRDERGEFLRSWGMLAYAAKDRMSFLTGWFGEGNAAPEAMAVEA
jgi:site-specific DNA recombinase